MFVLAAGRQQGKTQAIVDWYLEHPNRRVIFVANARRKEELVDRIGQTCHYVLRKGDVYRQVVVLGPRHSLLPINLDRGQGLECAIDDVEEVLSNFIGSRLEFMTTNATLVGPPRTRTGNYVEGEVVEWPDNEDGADALAYMMTALQPNASSAPKELER